MLKVIEKFVSIDGEGPTSGELATFIRFEGCNLRCSWCDTQYSWNGETKYEEQTPEVIYDYIKASGTRNVTLTGGEPLIQPGIEKLLEILSQDESLMIHIETNGSVDISPFKQAYPYAHISYIVDFKLPESKMMDQMHLANLSYVEKQDVYKFVVAGHKDLEMAYQLIRAYDLTHKCFVYLSPVTSHIEPKDMVEFMKEHQINEVRLQMQLHKMIWPQDMRGV